ncbi:MAG: alpha/beta fold hydrolase [Holophagales bacterium]|nr:alpha/beta fold hydrolase [Holophagales bacterium]
MRDGALLTERHLASDSGLIVVYLHGIMSSGAEFEDSARMLREATGAAVIRLDLRGHGLSAGSPGDIYHIGQWEEDVADVVSALQKENPGSRIILAGHSMGGGIVMRYARRHAEQRDVPEVNGYLLFAPHFGHRSPTSRTEPAEGADAHAPQLIKVHGPRTIGLVMLNILGIRGLNGLDTLYFDVPGDLPIHAYTFRAMASMSPDDYRAALTADAKPLLALVGQNDEAFKAKEYPAVIGLHRNGKTVIIAGETHDGVTVSPLAFDSIRDWSWNFRKRA